MRIEFGKPYADHDKKECVQVVELRFTGPEWDRFATTMQRAYDDDGKPNKERVLRAVLECLQSCTQPEMKRNLVVPIDRVSKESFQQLLKQANRFKVK